MNYKEYLQLNKILDAQTPKSSGQHDEMLFIVVHQVYELWMKQLLCEGGFLQRQLEEKNISLAFGTLKRMLKILKIFVSQVDIIETLSPLSFAGFRERLETASGLQSYQFRLLEFFLGMKRKDVFQHHKGDEKVLGLMKKAYQAPSMYDSLFSYLAKLGYEIPEKVLQRDVTTFYSANKEIEDLFFRIYKGQDDLSRLFELYVDFDEGLQEWRYRHVKMAERTIGNKGGTGGTSGVEYLKKTLFRPFFPELWNVRERF